jgi:hypothetical protein
MAAEWNVSNSAFPYNMTLDAMPAAMSGQSTLLSTRPGFVCPRQQFSQCNVEKNMLENKPCSESSGACFQDLYGNNHATHNAALGVSRQFAGLIKQKVLGNTLPAGQSLSNGAQVWCPRLGYHVDWNSVGISDCGACNVSQ